MVKIISFIKKTVNIALLIFLLPACHQASVEQLSPVDIIHQEQDELTQVIIYDVFTPPVASRIYAYTSLAAYEAIRYSKPGEPSLAEQINGFAKMPHPQAGKEYDFTLSAAQAFFTTAHKVVFSVDSLKGFEEKIYKQFKSSLKEEVYQRSIAFGDTIAMAIWARAKDDNYIKSRGKPKFLGSNEPGKWRPTQPDYFDGIEFCWNEIHPLLLDSASQFDPGAPPPYSTDTSSVFFKAVKEVYWMNKNLTAEQKTIAKFWDDNPFVMEHSGHLSFANKKITPGGHWMGIAAIAAKQTNADAVKTAKTYALTATALFDAFISCWNVKYKWNYIRPVTVINEFIEKYWTSFLQTPPFPEYTSGHSTISGAASTVLTFLYGDNFAFHDNSDSAYIGMTRDFDSFKKAADEVSISRIYGGIHYRVSLDTGLAKGRQLGEYLIKRLKLK
jgi:PAP2 superfamily